MESSFLSSLRGLPGVLGVSAILKNRVPFLSTGTLSGQNEVLTKCCVIVENPDLNTLSLGNVIYRVIQRDDSQIIALSTRVGRQLCIVVTITAYGRLVTHFYWNPAEQSVKILEQITKEVH
ncbi:hypothetical protein WA171_006645, partial [Blastocystis sp. BT1]